MKRRGHIPEQAVRMIREGLRSQDRVHPWMTKSTPSPLS